MVIVTGDRYLELLALLYRAAGWESAQAQPRGIMLHADAT